MKKAISLLFLVLSVGIFFFYSSYTQGSFDYNVAQFIGYLFYWSVTLFVVSLFAFILDQKKYRMWLLVSGVYVVISILSAWQTGGGNGAILSFDGKDMTWFFSGLYFVICIIYFLVQFFRDKK